MKIYGDLISGNCLKVKYVADYLGLNYDWMQTDVVAGDARKPEYLAINPAGQVPAIVLDNGKALAQSNAIMLYLAAGSRLSPTEPWLAAKVNEWLFWEQYSHETAIAVVRFHVHFTDVTIETRDVALVKKGEAALDRMEQHLAGKDYFVGDSLTLADISLYAYTQFAEEGGFSLLDRNNICGWLERCKAEFGF